MLRLAAAAMLANEPTAAGERGVCVNTASIAAFDGQIGQIAYSASKGGIVGMTLPGRPRPGERRDPGVHDRPGHVRHAAARRAPPGRARRARRARSRSRSRLGRPEEFAALAAHIVENEMLNGEVIRLDGALRMPPR